MKKIKVFGVDEGPWMKKGVFPYLPILQKYYDVELSQEPDFLFYSVWGAEFKRYTDCIRIFYTQENVRPNFNDCDYAIGFDRLEFGDRYLRNRFIFKRNPLNSSINYAHRKFCNFVYSNESCGQGAKKRIEFCKYLSKYKEVDCPGRVLNNMQNCISPRSGNFTPGKVKFLSDYKFTIAWENNFYPGYISEKLIHPFIANSIPIYMGDPDIALDFNTNAFINCVEYDNWEKLLEYIIFLDTNDYAYYKMLLEPPMRADYKLPDLDSFLVNIIEHGHMYEDRKKPFNMLDQPYASAYLSVEKLLNILVSDSKDVNIDDMIFINNSERKNHFDDLEKLLNSIQ